MHRIVPVAALLLISAAIAHGASLARADDARDLRDFATLALGREHEQTRAGRIIKWAKPVRVGVLGERRGDVLPLVRLHVQHLRTITGHDIRTVDDGEIDIAVIVVTRLDRANVAAHAAIFRRLFRDEAAYEEYLGRIERREFRPICLSTLRTRGPSSEIGMAVSFIPLDRGHDVVYQCVVEELAQLLGLPNDSDEIEPSIFNDRSAHIDLTDRDVLFLRVLYDPRIRPGMGYEDVAKVFPAALADARRGLVRSR
ncbi:MAG TPA: DUF2927 domain-containing protein [Alphaproteobacteria bacterium]|nr:DUF2927 domain-containing protein [Alphaproteobacteria bacterium]